GDQGSLSWGPLEVARGAGEGDLGGRDGAADPGGGRDGHAPARLVCRGGAGMIPPPPGFAAGIQALCREHNVLLIVDEVATGFGRTGTMFACEQERVQPDFLCLAKGISRGYLPAAAAPATEEIYEAFLAPRRELKQFFHGHTYTANPLA